MAPEVIYGYLEKCNCPSISLLCSLVAMGRSSVADYRWPHAQIEVAVAKRDLGKKATARAREKRRKKILFLMLPSAACAGPCCCRVVCFPVVSLHCDCFSLETSSVFSRLLVLCILPYHCRLCEWKNPLCNTSATSIRRKVYVSGHAPRAPTAHRRRQFGMAAKRAGAARRWKNKTK